MKGSLKHNCPYCEVLRIAPLNVITNPTDIYTTKCECGEVYEYRYSPPMVRKIWESVK
jgi:hypothetical protein